MGEAGFATSSIRKCHVTASAALKLAMREGWVQGNPARESEPPRLERPEVEVPTEEEVRLFLKTAKAQDADVHDFARLLASTGGRPGEVCALRWGDVDFEKQVLTIATAFDNVGNEVRPTKTRKVRRLTIDPGAVEVLRSRYGNHVTWVFPRPYSDDKPERRDTLGRRWGQVAKLAGVGLTPRMMRHFHATQLLASGKLSVRQVADRLGHSSPVVTLNVYARSLPALDVVAADVIGSVLAVP